MKTYNRLRNDPASLLRGTMRVRRRSEVIGKLNCHTCWMYVHKTQMSTYLQSNRVVDNCLSVQGMQPLANVTTELIVPIA